MDQREEAMTLPATTGNEVSYTGRIIAELRKAQARGASKTEMLMLFWKLEVEMDKLKKRIAK